MTNLPEEPRFYYLNLLENIAVEVVACQKQVWRKLFDADGEFCF